VNIPNSLTIARIFIVPLLVALLVQERISLHWDGATITNDSVALAIFWIAAATDLLDGYLARRWKQVTTIGTLLDPIADKLLVSAALISLVQRRVVPGWVVVLIIGREFAVSGLRSIAAAEGYTIKASDLAKTKTFSQVVAVTLLMLSIHHSWVALPARIALYLVVVFALWSAVAYFVKFWSKVDVATKQRRRQELLEADRIRRGVARAEMRHDWQKMREAAKADRLQRRRASRVQSQSRAQSLSSEAPDLPPSA
jgi:CDP-diacylglycerol--glycerol-3-phosphate 3-phosphatidyltransferase